MFILIHGDDTVDSRKKLLAEKEEYAGTEMVSLNGAKVDLTTVISALESQSLFSIDKTIVIENLFTGRKDKEKEKILEFIAKAETEANVIFYESKEVDKRTCDKFFKKGKIYLSKIPQTLFRFLDSLGQTHVPNLLDSVAAISREKSAEFLHTMLMRQLRYLIIAKDLGKAGLSDISPWQAGKFLSQSRYFTLEQLIAGYRQLLLMEYNIKTGLIPLKLRELLDIYFITF